MKRNTKVLAILMLAVTMMMGYGCSKDKEIGGYAYVDLGLPSGTLWAVCNVGADSPENMGDYFAWGETTQKTSYNWSTYKHCRSKADKLTKYCNKSKYGYNGFTDYQHVLFASDDAATANLGSEWRMPTLDEWEELYDNTTSTWTIQNGVEGELFVANGRKLFLPASGQKGNEDAGSRGYYWSSTLYSITPKYAWNFYFDSDGPKTDHSYRKYGFTVRPVHSPLEK